MPSRLTMMSIARLRRLPCSVTSSMRGALSALLLLSPSLGAAQAATLAGTIAPDAIQMEVDEMSLFFGGHAVVQKSMAQALINDKGQIVVPFNKFQFGEWVLNNHSNGDIGRTFYRESHHGALVAYRANVPYDKVIPFLEIASRREGYLITHTGEQVFRKVADRTWGADRPFWMSYFDPLGYFTNFGYDNALPADSGMVHQRYDGTRIVGRGNRRAVKGIGSPQAINFAIWGYANQLNPGTGSLYDAAVLSHWSNGLAPAQAVRSSAPGTMTSDPARLLAERNTAVGYINRQGVFQIPPAHFSVGQFSEGIAFVSHSDEFDQLTWGAIDTLGKMVIPYRFKLMPGMFSHGVALIRAVDSARYAFINKRGDIVATLGGFQGDTTGFQFGLRNEYAEESNPPYTGYGRFWFSGGVQFARLFFRADPERPREVKSEVVLLDSLGRFRPLERLLLAKLPPGGRVEILPGIKDGQFLYQFSGKGVDAQTGAAIEYDGALGIADIDGNIILPPRFSRLTLFDHDSALQYAQAGYRNRMWVEGTQGYIDRTGVFRIVKGKPKGGF